MNGYRILGAVSALTLAMIAQSPVYAEKFSVTGTDIVTHRHGPQTFPIGTSNLDKPTRITCNSDRGCSLIIETRVNTNYSATVCSAVDGVDAAPPCTQENNLVGITTFQGVPALSKGTHTVQTRIENSNESEGDMTGYQIVYTLYQH